MPPAFALRFDGPEGRYTIDFEPTDEWDGSIDVSIGGRTMRWAVIDTDREDDGGIVLGGMTAGTKALWNDEFWFEVRLNDAPPVIRYWGDKVVWREDRAADTNVR